ncbi:MAG: Ig-like domain-containing protein [candidate division WOR-3 bacterium]
MNCRQCFLFRLGLAVLFMSVGGCEWLLKFDKTPPVCYLRSPVDSSTVCGTVFIRAEAEDSIGVSRIEFYVDNRWLGTESTSTAVKEWATDTLPEQSWHTVFCVAYDLAGNAGFSDTANVRIELPEQRNVYHGTFELRNGQRLSVGFDARPGDSLLGEARVASNGVISRFLWLDRANFDLYQRQQPFTPIISITSVRELTVRGAVAASDSFYLVFENSTGYTQTYWARFRLE